MWGHLEAVCVFDKNHWRVGLRKLMREKHGPHQAELVGKEVCVIREDGTNQQDPAAKRKQAERVARGEGISCHLHV